MTDDRIAAARRWAELGTDGVVAWSYVVELLAEVDSLRDQLTELARRIERAPFVSMGLPLPPTGPR